jgi:flavin reductase (DIM6/NTAB) family NADH-FMN oxidoreductase RutF
LRQIIKVNTNPEKAMKSLQYRQIEPTSIEGNLIKKIESEWMLVTAGNKQKFNTMTANWGGMGYLWNKPVVFVFVRPERYTYEFMESSAGFTLSFFDETFREALDLCGSKSGRDCDKVAEAGLTPHFTELGFPAFSEAGMVLECRKLYAHTLVRNDFIDDGPVRIHYSTKGGLHKMYIAEIVRVWVK